MNSITQADEPTEETLLTTPTEPADPLAGEHTRVLLIWAGNPPQYALHVSSELSREDLNAFLPHELKRIAKNLAKEPIKEEDAAETLFDAWGV
jgi:hypothetical protein